MKPAYPVIYTRNFPRTAEMFKKYFEATLGEETADAATSMRYAFLTFPDGGEILLADRPGLTDGSNYPVHTGYAQLAISVGSREKVREITMKIHTDGHTVVNMPRETAYGRYEGVVLDFDGNFILITE